MSNSFCFSCGNSHFNCTCKASSNNSCDSITTCINKELYNIRVSGDTSLTNFCSAVIKCVDTQFQLVANGNTSGFNYYNASIFAVLKTIDGYDPDEDQVLTTDEGELKWSTGGAGGAVFIEAGTNINITGDGSSGDPFIITSLADLYTDENAQDAIGTILSDEFTYVDSTPSISIDHVDWSKITNAPSFELVSDNGFDIVPSGGDSAVAFTSSLNNSIIYSSSGNATAVTIGNGLDFTAGALTVDLIFTNGLTKTSETVKLGGTLTADTSINLSTNDLTLIGGNVGFRSTTPTRTITLGDESTGTDSLYLYASNATTAFLEAAASVGLTIASGSGSLILKPGTGGAGQLLVSNTPSNHVSQRFYTGAGGFTADIGVDVLDTSNPSSPINQLYLKGRSYTIGPATYSTDVVIYDPTRFSGITNDEATIKLLTIDSTTNRVRYKNSTGFIANQFTAAQTSSNWWISGAGRVGSYIQIANSARLVSDITNTLSVTTSTTSTVGGDIRARSYKFFSDIAPFDSPASVVRLSAPLNDTLQIDGNVTINRDNLNFASPSDPAFFPQISVGSGHPLKIRGNDSFVGNVDYVDIWNLNIPDGTISATNNKAFITFSLMRFNGTPIDATTNRGDKQQFGRFGFVKVDDSQTLYKGDFVLETVDGAISSGLPTEQFRIKYDGRLLVQNVIHEATDVDRFLVWNPSTKTVSYRTGTELASDIGGGGGGGLTSVGLTSTDLTVSGSPLISNGNITANIATNAVTYAKIQQVSAASKLLGSSSAGAGNVQEITVGSGLQLVGTTLSATVGGGTPTLQQVLTSGSILTGANTINAGGFNFTLNNNAIITLGATNSQLILDESGHDLTLLATDKTFMKIANFGAATNGDILTLVSNATGEVTWGAPGAGSSGTVTSFSAGDLSPLFTTTEATVTTTPALSFSLTNAGAHTYFGNNTGSTAAPSYKSNAALTKVDDTNITLTLGGAPTTALLEAASLTLGWTGQLSVARGGTGLSALGTALQYIRVNAGATALEYANAMTSLNGLTASTQLFATGTAGTDFNIVSGTATHTFNIPTASLTARGLISTGTQSIEGVKTFNVGAVFNESGADSDFRIEGDTLQNLFFVDASTDNIGIGIATPLALLHVSEGSSPLTGSNMPTFFVDSGTVNPVTAELKGSAYISGLVITNTGPSNLPFMQIYNEGNDKAWTSIVDIDNSYVLKEGPAVEGIPRIRIAPTSGTISFTGNTSLVNKINSYNNTAITDGQILIGHTANGTFEKSTVTGTVNQVNITNGAGALTLSLPQNIHTTAGPQFGSLGIGTTAGAPSTGITVGGIFLSSSIFTNATMQPSAGTSTALYKSVGNIQKASSGNHLLLAGMSLLPPNILSAAGTVTNTATLHIGGAPSATVSGSNNAIFVEAGTSRFNGDVVIGSGTSYSSGGYDLAVRNTTTGRVEIVASDVIAINSQPASYVLTATDRGALVIQTNIAANTVTIPNNTSVSYPIGTQIIVTQEGSGQVTITPAAGVGLNGSNGFKTRTQHSTITLVKKALNTWLVTGDTAP